MKSWPVRLLLVAALLLGALAAAFLYIIYIDKAERLPDGSLPVRAAPLVLDESDPARTMLGPLHYLGGWELVADTRSFGGLSALRVLPHGRLLALSDSAVVVDMPQPGNPGLGIARRLPRGSGAKALRSMFDSESLAHDPATGKYWVGFEDGQAICRYDARFTVQESCVQWPEMRRWPGAMGAEAMVRLPDGRFLVISEGQLVDDDGRDTLLFRGDPADPKTPPPIHLVYAPPTGYDPDDAVLIGNGQMLVLNRRATLSQGFTAIITLVDISDLRPGTVLRGREIAQLVPPIQSDNYEGMAIERAGSQRILWIVSDDNHLFFERTLLLKFALPEKF
jgi:hypothetical protein